MTDIEEKSEMKYCQETCYCELSWQNIYFEASCAERKSISLKERNKE